MPFCRGSSRPRDTTCVSYVSCLGRGVIYHHGHHQMLARWQFQSKQCVKQNKPLCERTPSGGAELALPTGGPYLPMAPELVPLHAVTVVESDGAAVGHGIEAELPGVQGLAWPDILSPAEGEELIGRQQQKSKGERNSERFARRRSMSFSSEELLAPVLQENDLVWG